MYSYVYYKHYTEASYDVAHLYEHLVVHAFMAHLESKGFPAGLVGDVSGETFHNVIFLRTTFYDKRVARMFDSFIESLAYGSTSAATWEVLLEELENESDVVIKPRERARIDTELAYLQALPWYDSAKKPSFDIHESGLPATPFVVRPRKKSSTLNAAISIYSTKLNNAEYVLYLGLAGLIGDAVEWRIRKVLHGYPMHDVPIVADDSLVGSRCDMRFCDDITLESITSEAQHALAIITEPGSYRLLEAYLHEHATHPYWVPYTIDYYRHTGVIAGPQYIGSYISPGHVHSVLSKLHVHVRSLEADEILPSTG